jgi:uncharacterized protein YjiS (DUF1127 family)
MAIEFSEAAMNRMPSNVVHPLGVIGATGRTFIRAIDRLVRALRNRRHAAMLAGFDERMLADIGLNRSDLRDAFAEPLWRDPTTILVDRACERRANRPPVTFSCNGRLNMPTTVSASARDMPARAARAS